MRPEVVEFFCFFCFKRFCFQALKGGVSRLSRGRSSPTRSARGRCVLEWKLSRPFLEFSHCGTARHSWLWLDFALERNMTFFHRQNLQIFARS